MRMLPITSSNIKAAGWEDNVLRVRFSNGSEYEYKNVPAEVYSGLMSADSQGKFFHKNIKAKFTGGKVEKERDDG